MIDKILVVGLGQCGNNQAEIFAKNGIKALGINTAQEDFKGLTHIEKFKIGEFGGSGKDRSLAIEQLKPSFGEIFSKINKESENKEFIILLSSLGGGTGSGTITATAKNIIKHTNKDVILVLTLPLLEEGARLQNNMLSCLKEIESMREDINIMLIENNRDYMKVNNKVYKKINGLFSRKGKEIISFDTMDLKNSLKGSYFDIQQGEGEFLLQSEIYDIDSLKYINMITESRKNTMAHEFLKGIKAADKNLFEYRIKEKDTWTAILSDLKIKIDFTDVEKTVSDALDLLKTDTSNNINSFNFDTEKKETKIIEHKKDKEPVFDFGF